MLRLQICSSSIPKRGNTLEECQDAHDYGPNKRRLSEKSNGVRIALADGASESAFSRLWAQLLVKDYVASPYVRPETMLRRREKLAIQWYRE